MRLWMAVTLAMASLTIAAVAQKNEKPKAKPTYSEEKGAKGSSRAVKQPSSRNASEQELRRVEQSSARTLASRKAEGNKAPRTGAVLKAEKQGKNQPIHFSSTGSSRGAKGSKSGNEYKGRLRHKGSHR
jgi:hypothetical protein